MDAYKGASLKRDGLPSLLQLHLKQFKYDYEMGETNKINNCCSFPLVGLYYFKQAWEERYILSSLCTIYLIDRNCDVLPVEYDIFRSLIDVGVKFGLRKIIHEVK